MLGLREAIEARRKEEEVSNPFLVFGQQMAKAPRPAYSGGGFWENFAAQAVPGLLGSLSTYWGKQQVSEQSKELAAKLLPILQQGESEHTFDKLMAVDPDLAMTYQLAKNDRDEDRASKAWEWAKQFEVGGGKEELDAKIEFEKAKIAEMQDANSIASAANQIKLQEAQTDAQRKIDADLFKMYTDANRNLASNKITQELETAKMLRAQLDSMAKNWDPSQGQEAFIAIGKMFAKLISSEQVSEGDAAMIASSAGFEGDVTRMINHLSKGGASDPVLLGKLITASNSLIAGKQQAYNDYLTKERELLGRVSHLVEGFDPNKVGAEADIEKIGFGPSLRRAFFKRTGKDPGGVDPMVAVVNKRTGETDLVLRSKLEGRAAGG
jgi:hypothetical protein